MRLIAVVAFTLGFSPLQVFADYGDFADTTFQCPALTTCPLLCVANETDCPESLACGEGTELCADGTCSGVGEPCDEDLESLCEYDCVPVTCRRDVNYYDFCMEEYGDLYDNATACMEIEDEYEVELFGFNEPGFLLVYYWVSGVTVLILLWCAFNQRIAPVEGSTKSIEIPMPEDADEEELSGSMTQTAYSASPVGMLIHLLTWITLLGFQGLLGVLVVLYYNQQEVIPRWEILFEDEEQVLLAFELTWMAGFIWTFTLKWPYSIASLFLRRSTFDRATTVAVVAPSTSNGGEVKTDVNYISTIKSIMGAVGQICNKVLAFIFSDVNRDLEDENELEFCKVVNDGDVRYFYFRLRRYNYDAEQDKFIPGDWEFATSIGDLVLANGGLSNTDADKVRQSVGPNTIEMLEPSFVRSLLREFSGPFYTYQSFFVWSWIPLWYYYMAIVWALVVLIGGFSAAFFNYRNEATLYRLSKMEGEAQVLRDEKWVTVSYKELVPGDIVALLPGITFCDMVVLKQTNLVLDESALTGESNPVAKIPLDASADQKTVKYNPKEHKKNTILAGTTILESSGTPEDLGLVTKTGSYTSKGEMLRDILSQKRHHFKFDSEVKIVLLILLIWACVAFAITVKLIEDTPIYGWFYGIYVFASALPPLLPTVFVVSVGLSGERLARKRIACTHNHKILVAGKVTKALFDKTGTLTKQGLDFIGARNAGKFGELDEPTPELALALASCHTLAVTASGDVIGNSVDRMMFLASGASLKQNDKTWEVTTKAGAKLTVLKRFEFDHSRMTQSVVVKTEDGKVMAVVKGSDQSILALSLPDSLPANFDKVVKDCAREGVYQISVAMKEVSESDYNSLSRDDLETEFTFTGALDFKNLLREESPSVIRELEFGGVGVTMVTGDSVLTGIHIARECGIIKESKKIVMASAVSEKGSVTWVNEDESEVYGDKEGCALAMSGAIWSQLYTSNHEAAVALVNDIAVFGRCSPKEKVTVVKAMNENGFVTAMCGDGGNDCGALKTAHVGIALSEAEASIVSPFTSLDKAITAILDVLKEGRCALANAIASYKYMLMYGQVETVNQMANAYFQITFAEWCWVFMDGFWMVSMAFALPLSRAQQTLSPERPTASLLGLHTMSSFLGVFFINVAFLCISLKILFEQDWFQCRKWTEADVSNVAVIGDNYESTVIFIVTGYQYVSSAMVYNFGYSFREAWIKNWVLVGLAIGYTTIHVIITLTAGPMSCFFRVNCSNEDVEKLGPTIMTYLGGERDPLPINNPFNTTLMPVDFRWTLIVLMVANTALIMAYDYFIVNGVGSDVARGLKNKGESEEATTNDPEEMAAPVSITSIGAVPEKTDGEVDV